MNRMSYLTCLLLTYCFLVTGCGEAKRSVKKSGPNKITADDINVPPPAEMEVRYEGEGSVAGLVLLEGQVPDAYVFTLKDDMRELTGKETITRQPWQVSEKGGLADCVVTLINRDRESAVKPEPITGVSMVKNGTDFIPRILVVTKGTTLDYRNENSPCMCFDVSASRHLGQSTSVPAGQGIELELTTVDICSVHSRLRPYYDAWIHVVDTPYYAITDSDGRFEFPQVPAGEYRMRVWHSRATPLRREVTVLDGDEKKLEFKFPPRGGDKKDQSSADTDSSSAAADALPVSEQ